MGSVMTHRAGLLCGFFRAGNDVLFFDRLNPKTRRQIRQVGDNGNERPARINMRPTLANLTMKMRDHGNKKVRRMFSRLVSSSFCLLFVLGWSVAWSPCTNIRLPRW